jgi:hypothetical protein
MVLDVEARIEPVDHHWKTASKAFGLLFGSGLSIRQ